MTQQQNSILLRRQASAKVNLYLRVGPRREDGFHSLVSWFCSVALCDELLLRPGAGTDVRLECDEPSVPTDGRNLILKAAALLRPFARRSEGAHVRLVKRIPMGGGLGGGSSDAAAALLLLNDFWKCGLGRDELHPLAAQLGSDVPFFLYPPSAICRGRGELVAPAPPPRAKSILIILPGIEMPTPAVYRCFDEMRLGTDLPAIERDLPQPTWETSHFLKTLVNDLEAPAFSISPALADLRQRAEQLLSRPVRMSGSGSTLFTLYDQQQEATAAADTISSIARAVACPLATA